MRILFSGLVAAGLLTSQWATAQCVRPADHAALDVAGLKTQLMVTALTCNADDRYNAFINKYKGDLNAEEKTAGSYFSHAYGRSGRSRQDDYMTNLANTKSHLGLAQGNRFCDHNLGVFDEVMALKSSRELEQYAAGRSTAAPTALNDCGSGPERPTRAAARSTRRGRG
jgi:hypothetical protein